MLSVSDVVQIQSYLCGEWRSGHGAGEELLNPATEAVMATATTKGIDMGPALAFARETGGPALRRLTFGERAAVLEQMAAALQDVREPLIASAIANGGCTRSDAKFDVDGAILVLSSYAEIGRALGGRRILVDGDGIQLGRSPRFWAQHAYTPRVGTSVLINAFNFPAWGFAEKAACSLLAGVPVLAKPATATALTAYLVMQSVVEKVDLPQGALSFLGGEPQNLLEELTEQDLLSFTGSAKTGALLKRHSTIVERSVPINIEADSLNAAVLGPRSGSESDVYGQFVREVTKEITQKAGQKCTAVRRILVPEERVEEVAASFSEVLGEVVVGDPSISEVRMGPLATQKQQSAVAEGVGRLLEEAEPVFGRPDEVAPKGVAPGTGFFAPILLLRAKDGAGAELVHNLEVFGPVATLVPYSGTADEAAELVKKGRGGLVASVYSDDRRFVEDLALEIAPFSGRVYLGSSKVSEYALGPGIVFPSCTHGGPGRAGSGEELGGLRGVKHYMRRTVFQGARPVVETVTGTRPQGQ